MWKTYHSFLKGTFSPPANLAPVFIYTVYQCFVKIKYSVLENARLKLYRDRQFKQLQVHNKVKQIISGEQISCSL